MNVAELFVTLGLKGGDKTVKGLKDTEDGLKKIGSTSLEVKAALIGAMYALERLFAASGQAGTDLKNFSASTGVAAKTLQQYQYAARQVGVSNKEMEGTFRSVQSIMEKAAINKGAPEGLGRLGFILKRDLGNDTLKDWAAHPEKAMQAVQEYLQKETDLPLGNETAKSMGFSDSMIAAARRNAFTPGQLNKAPTYSDKEITQLDKANAGWANLSNTVQMAIGHINAAVGPKLVDGINSIVNAMVPLIINLVKLADKIGLFDFIVAVLKSMAHTIEAITIAFGPALAIAIRFAEQLLRLKDAAGFSVAKKIAGFDVDSAKGNAGAAIKGAAGKAGRTGVDTEDAATAGLNATVMALKDAWYFANELADTIAEATANSVLFHGAMKFVESLAGFLKEIVVLLGQFGAMLGGSLVASAEKLLEIFIKYDLLNKIVETLTGALDGLTKTFEGGIAAAKALGNFIPGFNEAAAAAEGKLGTQNHIAPSNVIPFPPKSVLPSVPPSAGAGGGTVNNVNVQQTLQFSHDGKDDVRKIQETHKDSIKRAVNQNPARAQGS